MEMWEYEERQTRLQEAARDWLMHCYPTNAFVTLTSSAEAGISYETAEKVFGTFAHGLKCYLFGAKSKKRINLIPVVEGYDKCHGMSKTLGLRQGTHIHCLMNLPGNPMDHMDAIRDLWMDSSGVCGDPKIHCPNNDDWFLPLDTAKKKRVFTNYALKSCETNLDAVLVKFVPFRLTT
jgi:hypothetical protein